MQLVIIQGDEDRPGLEQHLASHQGGPSLQHQVLTMMKKLQDLVKTVNNRRHSSGLFVTAMLISRGLVDTQYFTLGLCFLKR